MTTNHRLIGLVLVSAALAACTGETGGRERNIVMSSTTEQQNKDAVRQLFEDGFNRDRSDVIDKIVGEEYVDATGARGPGAFKQTMARLRAAFPDIHYTIESILAEGQEVAIRWHWSGTHRGAFRGLPPTQRSITNSGAAVFQVRAGKIVSAALETDRLGFLQSIGAVASNEVLFAPARTPPIAAASQ